MVVKEQAEPQQPGRAEPRMMREDESQGADDVGRDLPKDFALDQCLADQTKLVIFEIAQAAMHEFGRPGRRPTRQIIHFAEKNRISPTPPTPREAAAIEATTNDDEVENPIQRNVAPERSPSLWRFHFRFSINHNRIRKQVKKG